MRTTLFISTLIIILSIGCSSDTKKGKPDQISGLKGSTWVYQPFDNCIDTLRFSGQNYGYYYSCEHTWLDSITYALSNDSLLIDLYGYESENDLSGGLIVMSKYSMIMDDGNLVMTDIRHRWQEEFQSVDKQYVEDKTYLKVK